MSDRLHRARRPVNYPDAPTGTCKHCGRSCAPHRRTHDECREDQAAANDYVGTARKREGEKQRCIDCGYVEGQTRKIPGDRPGGWKWYRVKIQRDHPQELIDNGPRDWTVARCTRCHSEKTTREKERRRMATSKTKGKSKGKTPEPETPWWSVPVGVAFVVAALVLWRMPPTDLDDIVDAVVRALVTAVVVTLVLVLGWWLVKRHLTRRREVALRLGDGVARLTNTDPSKIRLQVRRWRGGRPVRATCRYGSIFDDAEGGPGRAAVEDYLLTKVGEPLDFVWRPWSDTVSWQPASGDVADQDPVEHVVVDSHHDRVAAVQGRVEESVAAVIKGDVEVEWGSADAIGPRSMRVHYPSAYNDESPDVRQTLVDRVNNKAPGRWKAEWDTEQNVVRFTRRPDMPKTVDRPVPAPEATTDTWRLPLGVDEGADVVHWDLRTMPHMLVAGSTGGGKTVVLSGLIVEALARGFEVVIVDGKGTALAGFRDWPGVRMTGLGEPDDMADAMGWAEDVMRKRYQRIRDFGQEPESFTPMLVVLDEAAEFATSVQRWHAGLPQTTQDNDGERIRRPKNPPSLDAWRSIARLGREGHVHLVVGIQQAAASFFGGTESREQLPARVGCGPLKAEGARMLFGRGDVGRDVPPTAKGRATVEVDDHGPREMQGYWTPTPKPDGKVKPADAPLLDGFRASAEQRHHHPTRTAFGHKVIEPRKVTPPSRPEWEYVDLDDLDEHDVVRLDIDGEQVEVTLTSVPCESVDQEGVVEVEYDLGDGERRLTLLDADDALERRSA